MAIPAKVLAEDPPETVSVLSLKLPLNKLLTVAPEGLAVSSFTATNVALPEATGASLTAVIDVPKDTVAAEIAVVPPFEETFTPVAPDVTVVLESINLTVNDGAVPFQLAAGKKRNLSLAPTPSVKALLSDTVPIVVQVLPSVVYCQFPLLVSAV